MTRVGAPCSSHTGAGLALVPPEPLWELLDELEDRRLVVPETELWPTGDGETLGGDSLGTHDSQLGVSPRDYKAGLTTPAEDENAKEST